MGPKRRQLRKSTSLTSGYFGKKSFAFAIAKCERTLKLKSVNEKAAGLLAQLLISQMTLNCRSRIYFSRHFRKNVIYKQIKFPKDMSYKVRSRVYFSRDFRKRVIFEHTKFPNYMSFKVSQNLTTFYS